MLCCVAEKGAPPPGIVGPLACDSQQPVTNQSYVISGESWLAERPSERSRCPMAFYCDGISNVAYKRYIILFSGILHGIANNTMIANSWF